MKKTTLATLVAASVLTFSPAVMAQAPAQGGFAGPTVSQTTVEQAKQMRDDTYVTLQGNIVQHVGGDNYLFKDATGTITVDIENDKWRGQNVKPENLIELRGEVDKDWNSVEIDVDSLTILK